jgi:hypothetical protein
MKLNLLSAIFYIALCALSTGATGQNVYKCGNAYSQKPCADAVVVDVQDSRTPVQKAESDALIKRDAAAANAMEKTRLKEEAQQRTDNAKLAAAAAKNAKASAQTDARAPSHPAKAVKASAKKKKKPRQAASAGK